MKNKISLLVLIILSSCSNKERTSDDIPNFSISKQSNEARATLEQSHIVYNQANYYSRALSIFNDGKKKLKQVLPNSFKKITERVALDLESYDKAKKLSHTKNQYIENVNDIQVETGVYLLDEEIRINEIYNETLEELSVLNDDYFNYFIANNNNLIFEDYYKVSRIRIAEEVLEKLDELVNDEKERESREANANKLNIGLTLIALIPGAGACTKILEGLTKGARASKNGLKALQTSNKIAKMSNFALRNNKNTSIKLAKSLSNNEKRGKIANQISKTGSAAVVADFGTEMHYSFKSKNNEIKGRIGDGADWVLAVHFQQIRDIITKNKKIIPNYQAKTNEFRNIE